MRGLSSGFRKGVSAATLALVVSAAGLVAPAQAQFFNFWNRGPAPWQQQTIGRSAVNGIIYRRGMRLLRPARRNGGVYVADTVDRFGHSFRLIIDASNGRVLEIFNTSRLAGARDQRQQQPALAHHGKPSAHDVLARLRIKHPAHTRSSTPPVAAQPKTLPKADIPIEAAMPAPVAKPATAAIAPANATLVTPAAKPVTSVQKVAAPAVKVVTPAAKAAAAPAPAAPPHKINDVPVAPLD